MMNNKFFLSFFALTAMFVGQSELAAQHIHYTTLHGDCEDTDSTAVDCREPPHCCHHHYRFPSQQPDPMAEELFNDSGWPSRRDDELSDILMR